MAINKIMLAALKALSYTDFDVAKNYKLDRQVKKILNPAIKPLYNIWDHQFPAGDYHVPVRIFLPDDKRSEEIILFFHGGGWVAGDIDTYTHTCGVISNTTGRRVMSVDYRLAPEYPFPTAVHDCYAAARELYRISPTLGVREDEIILMGDSAGGNLSAVVSLMAAERGEFSVHRQILIYPSTDSDHTPSSPHRSIVENGYDYLLTSKMICDYLSLYLPQKEDYESPYYAPMLAEDLSGQPDTLIITAEFDPLRDEGEAYAEKLRSFGNRVAYYRIHDAVHGFLNLPKSFEIVKEAYAHIVSFLNGKEDYHETGMESTR